MLFSILKNKQKRKGIKTTYPFENAPAQQCPSNQYTNKKINIELRQPPPHL